MRITKADSTSFVIIARNKKNSEFHVKQTSDFKRELNNQEVVSDKILMSEWTVIEKINSDIKFYTYNSEDKTFTNVINVNGNIKSVKNNSKIDNLSLLPLIPITEELEKNDKESCFIINFFKRILNFFKKK